MCEICAFACKRKYELHSHMLTKHSGADKQLATLKCRYCSYATSYRQALQNHENCKHTKQREFRCALCPYSCFSSVSLFLHKRKVHGYTPGDKAWLENYTAKEKERSSAEFPQGFYHKPLSAVEPPKRSTSEGPIPSCKEHAELSDSADPGLNQDRALDSQRHSADVPPVAVSEDASGDAPSVGGPEEFYTLVLTTFPAPSLQSQDSSCTRTTPNSPPGDCSGSRTWDQEAGLSTSSAQDDGAAVADAAGARGDLDNPSEVLPDASRAEIQVCRTSKTDARGSSLCSLPEKNPPVETEIGLDAMKKRDKEQAENMVLEGRVQMLVVQNKDSFHCGKASRLALKRHCRAPCHAGTEEHKCRACGALLEQEPGLDAGDHEGVDGVEDAALQSADVGEVGKFKGKSREFPSANAASAERRLPLCRTEPPVLSEGDGDRGNEPARSRTVREEKRASEVSAKRPKSSCPNCAFKCGRKKAAGSHAERGTPDEIRCSLCPFVAGPKMPLRPNIHDQKQNGEAQPKRLRCPHCSFTCEENQRSSLRAGAKHTGARPYRCRYCCFSTARRYRLQQHESLHTGTGRHGCAACNKTFGTLTKLRRHKVRVHDKRPTHFCSLCDFGGYSHGDVRRHNSRCHSGELEHPCSHCGGKFSSELALRCHRKRVHRPQGSFRCEQCDCICSSAATLRTHQERQHPQTRRRASPGTSPGPGMCQESPLAHQCQLCPFATGTRRSLAQHVLGEHEEGPPEDKPLQCSACQFACRHQLVLEQHLRSHRGRRLYKCADCEYATRNKQKMTWHVRTHTGEKPYSCELCSYACADPSRLKV